MTAPARRVVLGTRGSELARAQAALVANALRSVWPQLELATEIIRTSGDEREKLAAPPTDLRAGRKGMFTREIERALLDRAIDVAVHSAKDLPSEMTEGLDIGAVLPRGNVAEVLIAKTDAALDSLGEGTIIATSSVRRQHQLRTFNQRIHVVDLRGNVPTRLRKLADSNWHGIVLARAGLERLGFDLCNSVLGFDGKRFRVSLLPNDDFLPAGGQGIIALQTRSDDDAVLQLVRPINHDETLRCLRAERDFLRRLNADCNSAVGVLAIIEPPWMTLRAQVFDAEEPREGTVYVRVEAEPEAAAASLFQWMYGRR